MTVPGALEVALDADRRASMWAHTYTSLTAATRRNSMTVTAGRRDRTSGLSAAALEMVLDNGTGRLTPGHPESALYPGWDQGALLRYRVEDQVPYLLATGVAGGATTPDVASLDVLGDNFGAIQFRGPVPTPRGILGFNTDIPRTASLVGKYTTTLDQRTIVLYLLDGLARLAWSTDGTSGNTHTAESTVIVPQPGAGSNTLGWYIDVNVAGTSHAVTFYWHRGTIAELRAAITAGDSTVQLGEQFTDTGVTSLFNSTSLLKIADVGAFGATWGQIEAFEWRSGDHTGTVVANPNFTIQTPGATSFADTAAVPKTWTITAGASIADTEVRQVAEVSSIRPRWPGLGVDEAAQVEVTAQGISRRLRQNQRTKSLESSLFRWITTLVKFRDTIVAYWPYEDGSDATQIASPIDGCPPILLSGDYALESNSPLPAAKTVMRVGSGDVVYQEADIPPIPQVVGVNWQVTRYFNTDEPAVSPATTQLMAVDSNGRVATWRVTINDTQLAITGLDKNDVGVVLDTRAADPTWFQGPCFVELKVADDGVNVDWEVSVGVTATGLGYDVSGTYVGNTGIPLRFRNNLVGPPGGIDVSHLVVTQDDPQITNDPAAAAYVGELDYDRIRRLCLEEGAAVSTHCAVDDPGERMGPQLAVGFVDLLEQAAAAGGGLLTEHRTEDGFQYRTRRSMTNQAPRLTVDQGLMPPFEPAADDAGRVNLVKVSRDNGSSHTERDQVDIDKRGEYPDGPSFNLFADRQTEQIAGWLLHLGTPNEMRMASLTIEAAVDPTVLPAAWIGCSPGDIVTCVNPPAWWPAETIDQLIEGYEETWSPFLATVVPNTSPASLWTVGEADATRADTSGSVLHALVDDNDTTLDVATTGRWARWRSAAGGASFPFPVAVGGERMAVSDIDDVPFTFGAVGTVTHGVNASVTPGAPAGVVVGSLLVILAAIRNLGAGTVNVPTGWTRWPLFADTENVALLARVAEANGEAMPSVTFSGGVANADTSAQCARFAGGNVHDVANLPIRWGRTGVLSAQDIVYPATRVPYANSLVLYVGWKSDDWTSVAAIAGATEIGEPDTTTGDDQGIVWDHLIQTTAADIAAGSFVVTGGAAAVTLGGVIVLTPDRQTFTVARSDNGIVKAHAAGAALALDPTVRTVAAR